MNTFYDAHGNDLWASVFGDVWSIVIISPVASVTSVHDLTGVIQVAGTLPATSARTQASDLIGAIYVTGSVPYVAASTYALTQLGATTHTAQATPGSVVTTPLPASATISVAATYHAPTTWTLAGSVTGVINLLGSLPATSSHTRVAVVAPQIIVTTSVATLPAVTTTALNTFSSITVVAQVSPLSVDTRVTDTTGFITVVSQTSPITVYTYLIDPAPLVVATTQQAFDQVNVDYAVHGTSRITWTLQPRFTEPPYTFQLQAANGNDIWHDVGDPATTAWEAFDDMPRLCGGTDRSLRYRVKLQTIRGIYYSQPATTLGQLTFRQWGHFREIIRKAQLDVRRRHLQSFPGYVLKRQLQGDRCPDCYDQYTGGTTNSDCPTCNGTSYVPGYWVAGVHALIDLSAVNEQTWQRIEQGTGSQSQLRGRFIGLPELRPRDIWVSTDSDRRYHVSRVSHAATINQVPLITDADLTLLPADDVAYAIDELP